MSVPPGCGHSPPEPRTLSEEEPVVVVLDGHSLPVTGKAAAILRFVVAIADELNASDFGTLTFDCAQKSGKPKFLRTYPEIKW